MIQSKMPLFNILLVHDPRPFSFALCKLYAHINFVKASKAGELKLPSRISLFTYLN